MIKFIKEYFKKRAKKNSYVRYTALKTIESQDSNMIVYTMYGWKVEVIDGFGNVIHEYFSKYLD